MVQISAFARIGLIIFALLLLGPVVSIPFQDEVALSQFHNRTLSVWPTPQTFLNRPELYVRQASNWIADRAGPVVFATKLQKRILYYVFATPPEPRVSLGRGDHIFWNGINNAGVNALFANNCILSHSAETVGQFEKALVALKAYGVAKRVRIYAVVVPMAPTLFADDLPAKVPESLRNDCLRVLTGDTPLRKLAHRLDLDFVYPFDEMKAKRDDPGFFPSANYHPGPASLSMVRSAFIKHFDLRAPIDEKVTSVMVPSEILGSYGIGKLFPDYVINSLNIRSEDAANASLNSELKDLFVGPPSTNLFSNDAASAEGSTLMLSDSVGFTAGRVFAPGFKRLTWVYTNGMRQERIDLVIDRVAKAEKFDSIIMLINEAAIGRITTWAETLARPLPQ